MELKDLNSYADLEVLNLAAKRHVDRGGRAVQAAGGGVEAAESGEVVEAGLMEGATGLFIRLIAFTMMKSTNAMIMKLITSVMKLP